MRQIAILSGKGGTGKTSITAALVTLVKDGIYADCDVEASDLFIILQPQNKEENEFAGGQIAIIDNNKCTGCNKCYEVCRFNAVKIINNSYKINKYSCEGCGFCVRVCPEKAIVMERQQAGYWYKSDTRFGKLVYAKLFPGQENSGKLVTMVRHQAKLLAEEEKKEYIIIDGPPGIGCPVISTLSGVDDVIIVTEPTKSGLSDLKRIAKTALHFNIPVSVIVNKYDLNKDIALNIRDYSLNNNFNYLGEIPFDKIFVKAMVNRKSVIEYDRNSEISKKIIEIAKKMNITLKEEFNE